MGNRTAIRHLVDLLMTVAMPLLMAYMLIGEDIHEWIGTGVFLLFIIHHILNYKWIPTLVKGVYTPARVVNTAVNILILLCMLGLMYSGITMSRFVFDFLPIRGGAGLARQLHMLCSYWGFALMSLHLGTHWSFILGGFRKMTKAGKSTLRSVILKIVCAGVSCYGIYAFFKRDLLEYMLLRVRFVFFDFSESVLIFLLDYAAVMTLFAAVGHYFMKLMRKSTSAKKNG